MQIAHRLTTLAVLLLAVVPSVASATQRRHSSVATYPAHGLNVSALHMSIRPAPRGRLHVTVSLSVANPGTTTVRRILSVGPCRGGETGFPVCPAAATKLVVLSRHAMGSYTLTATIGEPTAAQDSVQAILAKPGRHAVNASAVDAVLLLGSRAWSGASSGETFGIAFTPNANQSVTRAAWDLPALDPDVADMDLLWSGVAPATVTTSLQRCTGARCVATALTRYARRGGVPPGFAKRGKQQRMGADSAAVAVTAHSGATLMSASLPWPK